MAVVNRVGSLDVKLIDFGLAKGAGAETLDASRITRTQDFVGSPAFASPEQCETKKLDIRSIERRLSQIRIRVPAMALGAQWTSRAPRAKPIRK
jgi:serine/threonine protein kinase